MTCGPLSGGRSGGDHPAEDGGQPRSGWRAV